MGMVPIAQALDQAQVGRFGVASIEEAIVLRQTTSKPIQILGELLPREIELAVRYGIVCPGSSEKIIRALSREADYQKKKVRLHYLIDTGMGRLGLPLDQAPNIINRTQNLPYLEVEGIYSHFPWANQPKKPINKRQISEFKALAQKYPFPLKHLANSDGINNLPDSYFNMVRTGINLLGAFDLLGHHAHTLKPALTLQTELIANRGLKKGSPIGYGCTHRLPKDSFVGTIPVGYADGVPLASSGRGQVLIQGRAYPIIGKVSMDYTTIALGSDNLPLGVKVIIIGKSKSGREITVEDLAKIKATHPYDIICSIGPRVKRIYQA